MEPIYYFIDGNYSESPTHLVDKAEIATTGTFKGWGTPLCGAKMSIAFATQYVHPISGARKLCKRCLVARDRRGKATR